MPMHVQACQEIHYTADRYADEQDVLCVALFPNILHIFRVSAVSGWLVTPPEASQDTNKMQSTVVKTTDVAVCRA